MATQTYVQQRPTSTAKPWMHGPISDVVLGWCWLPVALLMHQLGSSITRTQALMAIIFLISFAHQPLTLGLVYGDPLQHDAHRRLYRWTPLIAAAVIVVGVNLSLTAVAVVAGLWNAEHTLMQRYGLTRIYGRKAGDDHGRLEKPLLIVWLVTALAYLGAFVDLGEMATRLGTDETNSKGIELLGKLSGIATIVFWVGVVVSVALAAAWLRAELGRPVTAASRAKWIYMAGTLGLVLAVMIDPLAGIAGYVAAHAIEYFAVVHSTLRRRSLTPERSPIAVASATAGRRLALYAGYFAGLVGLVWVTWTVWDGRLYAFAILFFGALHILYDGMVWKLRRPSVAASVGL